MFGLKSYFVFLVKQHCTLFDRLEHIRIFPIGYLCNHSCPMCWRNQINIKNKNKYFSTLEKKSLTLNEYKKLIHSFPKSATHIEIVGGGEPLLYPDINQLITYIKKQNLHGQLITNGAFLHRTSPTLIHNKWDSVRISFHASTKNVYKKVHKVDDYNKVVSNIKELIQLRGKSPFPKISLLFVIQKDNAHEISTFFRLAESLGVDEVEYDSLLQLQNITSHLNITAAQKNHVILNLKKYQNKTTLIHNIKDVIENFTSHPNWNTKNNNYYKHKFCAIVQNNLDMDSMGNVAPCCIALDDKNFNKSIRKESLIKIWKTYAPFRKEMRTGKFKLFCKKYCNYTLDEYPHLTIFPAQKEK